MHAYKKDTQKCENLHVKANDDESTLHDNTQMPQGVSKQNGRVHYYFCRV